MEVILQWFKRTFSNPQIVILCALLAAGLTGLLFFGEMLAPALAAVAIAYLLDGLVMKLQKLRVPRLAAVLIVFLLFMALLVITLLLLIPYLFEQSAALLKQTPDMLRQLKTWIESLPAKRPDFIRPERFAEFVDALRTNTDLISALQGRLAALGEGFLGRSFALGKGLVTFLVYMVLVPLMIFFFLKDKQMLLDWCARLLPRERGLAVRVWTEVDQQLANYIRGKVLEILIVWLATYIVFRWINLDYAMLLALFTGLSVLLPYIGATLMTIPVVLVALFQADYATQNVITALVAYLILQALDGNVLAPLLLSGVTKLHPVAIIIAILIFGGIWGFWGVFFAIPLATLVNAVLHAWRSQPDKPAPVPDEPGWTRQTRLDGEV
ncbi:MAG: AI-2E family transporter [Kiritimatiellia bacterium]